MTLQVNVHGDQELIAAMHHATKELEDLTPELNQASKTVYSAARSSAPRLTGKLAASMRSGADKRKGFISAGNTSVPYARIVHYGWPAIGRKGQPWISQAAQKTEPKWITFFKKKVTKVVEIMGNST